MDAKVGDEIRVDAKKLGGPERRGRIVEVRGTGGVTSYLVQWSDGHESVFFPGSTAHVVRSRA
jgi:hypothetical protein